MRRICQWSWKLGSAQFAFCMIVKSIKWILNLWRIHTNMSARKISSLNQSISLTLSKCWNYMTFSWRENRWKSKLSIHVPTNVINYSQKKNCLVWSWVVISWYHPWQKAYWLLESKCFHIIHVWFIACFNPNSPQIKKVWLAVICSLSILYVNTTSSDWFKTKWTELRSSIW